MEGCESSNELASRCPWGLRELVTDVLAGSVPVGARVTGPGGAMFPPTWADANDTAASDDAGLVFVQLPRACLQDPSGAWLDLHVLDAMRYILSCADAQTEQIVINLSFGPQRGPNDGTVMFEKALDELGAEFPHLTIALAAGNSFLERGHASFELKGQGLKNTVLANHAGRRDAHVCATVDARMRQACGSKGHRARTGTQPLDQAR